MQYIGKSCGVLKTWEENLNPFILGKRALLKKLIYWIYAFGFNAKQINVVYKKKYEDIYVAVICMYQIAMG